MLFNKRIAKRTAGALALVMAVASVSVFDVQAASPNFEIAPHVAPMTRHTINTANVNIPAGQASTMLPNNAFGIALPPTGAAPAPTGHLPWTGLRNATANRLEGNLLIPRGVFYSLGQSHNFTITLSHGQFNIPTSTAATGGVPGAPFMIENTGVSDDFGTATGGLSFDFPVISGINSLTVANRPLTATPGEIVTPEIPTDAAYVVIPISVNLEGANAEEAVNLTISRPGMTNQTVQIASVPAQVAAGVTSVNINSVQTVGGIIGTGSGATITLNTQNLGNRQDSVTARTNPLHGITLTLGGLNNQAHQFVVPAAGEHAGALTGELASLVYLAGTYIPLFATHSAARTALNLQLLGHGATPAPTETLSNGVITNLAPRTGSVNNYNYAFFSHNNTRINIVLGAGAESTAANPHIALANTIVLQGLNFRHGNIANPTFTTTPVQITVGSNIGNVQSFSNTGMVGAQTHSFNAVNFPAQAVNATVAAHTAANTFNAGRAFNHPILTDATALNNLTFADFGGVAANITVADTAGLQGTALGATNPGLSAGTWTLTVTDSEGNAIPDYARIAAAQFNTGGNINNGGFNNAQFINHHGPGLTGNAAQTGTNARRVSADTSVANSVFVNFAANGSAVTISGMQHTTNSAISLVSQLRLSTNVLFNGNVYVTVTNNQGFSQTLHVATARAPISISAQPTYITTGVSALASVGNITITENFAGAIPAGSIIDLRLTQEGAGGIFGIPFHTVGGGNVSVAAGEGGTALTIQTVANAAQPGVAGQAAIDGALNNIIRLTIGSQSTGQPSVITVSGLSINPGFALAGSRNLEITQLPANRSLVDNNGLNIANTAANPNIAITNNFQMPIASIPYLTIGVEGAVNVSAAVTAQTGTPFITVNGAQRTMTNANGQAISVINHQDFNFLPLRGIAEAFGIEPAWGWNPEGQLFVAINLPGRNVVFTQGSDTFTVNGVESPSMNATVQNFGGSTFLPFAYLGLALNIPVTWEHAPAGGGQLIHFNQPNLGTLPTQNPNFYDWE